MVRDPQAVIALAKQYINDVRKTMPVDKVYLYGSYAKNEQRADSDVDLCFFSSDFENKPRLDVMLELSAILLRSAAYRSRKCRYALGNCLRRTRTGVMRTTNTLLASGFLVCT
jgi:predicted nucleotidyltransferase